MTGASARVEPVTLEGRHVRLEPLSRTHVSALLAAATGPRDTFRYTWVPGTEPEMAEYVSAALRAAAERTALPFVVIPRASGVVGGSTRFGNIEHWSWPAGNPNRRGEHTPDAVEIGWTWYAPDVQRTRVNTECKLLMLTHAFEVWRVHRVRLMTDARNERSRRAILRLGARFDGVLRGQTVGADGTVRDSAVYSVLDPEWAEVKAHLQSLLK